RARRRRAGAARGRGGGGTGRRGGRGAARRPRRRRGRGGHQLVGDDRDELGVQGVDLGAQLGGSQAVGPRGEVREIGLEVGEAGPARGGQAGRAGGAERDAGGRGERRALPAVAGVGGGVTGDGQRHRE